MVPEVGIGKCQLDLSVPCSAFVLSANFPVVAYVPLFLVSRVDHMIELALRTLDKLLQLLLRAVEMI